MCFLKQLKPLQSFRTNHLPNEKILQNPTSSDSSMTLGSHTSEIGCRLNGKVIFLQQNSIFTNFLNVLGANSSIISSLQMKMMEAAVHLNGACKSIQEERFRGYAIQSKVKTQDREILPSRHEDSQSRGNNSLIGKLFGKNSYKYRIQLVEEISNNTLYKDRNFNLKVRLVEISTSKYKRNSNLINICLGVADSNGQWVYKSKEGQPFLKGKVEIEIYHGEGQFCKIAAKDVSRSFQGKKVNFIVYAKPSILRYSGESSLETRVEDLQIEPLVIPGITIKAKRRQ